MGSRTGTPGPLGEWGQDRARSQQGVPFLQYEPRPVSLVQLLNESHRWDHRTHLVCGAERIGFAGLRRQVAAAARVLGELGVGRGDQVAILGWNSTGWVISFWASTVLGAVPVFANAWWSRAELDAALRVCDPVLVLSDDAHRDLPGPGYRVRNMRELTRDPAAGDSAGQPGLLPVPAGANEGDPAAIIFTSGSTGAAKGAVLSHRSIIAQLHSVLAMARKRPSELPADAEPEVTLVTGPLFHVGALQTLVRSVVVGGELVFLDGRFDPAAVVKAIESERITRWGGVPTMVSRVLAYLRTSAHDVSSLRALTFGGSAVAVPLLERTREAFPNAHSGVSQLYGMTEAGGSLTFASGRSTLAHPDAVGRALPLVELRISAPDEEGVGEILARTPTQMSGYWGTAESPIAADGWLQTGDLGRIDEDGFLYVVGRSKDVIIRGGENIAAGHVESALLAHPEVVEAGVVGVPDPDLGERVGAVVCLRPGADVSPDELRGFLRGALSYFEIPELLRCGTSPLPTTGSNKIDKAGLRVLLSEPSPPLLAPSPPLLAPAPPPGRSAAGPGGSPAGPC